MAMTNEDFDIEYKELKRRNKEAEDRYWKNVKKITRKLKLQKLSEINKNSLSSS
jgi:hypothetical protein